MGVRVRRTKYVLEVETLPGSEIEMSALTVGELRELSTSGDIGAAVEMFAAHLVAWNLDDESGAPIPCSVAGVNSLEITLVKALIEAWTTAVTTGPLDETAIPMTPSGAPGS